MTNNHGLICAGVSILYGYTPVKEQVCNRIKLTSGNSKDSKVTEAQESRLRRGYLWQCHSQVSSWKLFKTRCRASTSMYSLTFCIHVMLPERHQWKAAVQAAAVMLRTPPVDGQSPASSACRPRPADRSHYVVISRDGCKLVTRVRVMLPLQRNPCTDCKSAQ